MLRLVAAATVEHVLVERVACGRCGMPGCGTPGPFQEPILTATDTPHDTISDVSPHVAARLEGAVSAASFCSENCHNAFRRLLLSLPLSPESGMTVLLQSIRVLYPKLDDNLLSAAAANHETELKVRPFSQKPAATTSAAAVQAAMQQLEVSPPQPTITKRKDESSSSAIIQAVAAVFGETTNATRRSIQGSTAAKTTAQQQSPASTVAVLLQKHGYCW